MHDVEGLLALPVCPAVIRPVVGVRRLTRQLSKDNIEAVLLVGVDGKLPVVAALLI